MDIRLEIKKCIENNKNFIVNGGAGLADTWTAANIAMIMNTITFTPIDGEVVKGNMSGFNDGTSN